MAGEQQAVVTLTAEQLEALVASAVAKATASLKPLAPVVVAHGMAPRSVVQPHAPHERELEAGVVEKVHPDGTVTVKFDRDGAFVDFKQSELKSLLPH